MNSRTSNISKRIMIGAVAGGLLLAGPAAMAQSKQLILQTQPEPTVIELQGNMQIDGDGNINVTPVDPEACTATGTCEGVEVAINSFTINSQASSVTVAQGENLTFRWQTRGAWACDGSGLSGWTGNGKSANNSGGISVSTNSITPGNYVASLNCYNGSVEAASPSTVAIEVTDDEPPPPTTPEGCEDRTLPSTWARKTTGSNSCSYQYQGSHGLITTHDCRHFNQVWPFDFDQQESLQRVLGVGTTNNGRAYIALEFNSGNLDPSASKKFTVGQPQSSNLDNGPKLYSISRCPGDFNAAEILDEMGPGCIKSSLISSFSWGGTDSWSNSNVCALEPNTRYYFNIIYTNSPVGTDPSQIVPWPDCASGAGCGTRYSADNY